MSTTTSDKSDLYRILGVARTADAEEIKKAYRTLAKQHHPDRNPGNKAAEDKFKEVSAAFAVLGDEKKRAVYDEFGPDGLREGFDADAARNYKRWAQQAGGGGGRGGPTFDFGGFGGGGSGGSGGFGGFGDLDDLLGSLFGGGGPRSRAHRRGADTEAEVTLSVRESLEGAEVSIGGLPGHVRIPPGVATGQKIRVPGKGTAGPAGAGDLLIRVHVSTPIGFRSDPQSPDDLELDLPLTVGQAMLGASVTVPTPEATTVQLKVPPGAQGGQRLRLRGKGMPRKGGERGDLFARLVVRVPRTEDPRAIELVRELEQFYA